MNKGCLDYNLKVRLPLIAVVALLTFFTVFFASYNYRNLIGYKPEQPIRFSHKLHAGDMQIDCRYCHSGVEKGRHAMVPPTETCMNCHSIAKKDSPEIKKLAHFFETGTPIPWERVHKVPDFVYFDHSVHLAKGVDCVSCHGNVNRMDVVQKKEGLTMGFCLNCHRQTETVMTSQKTITVKHAGGQHCSVCHR